MNRKDDGFVFGVAVVLAALFVGQRLIRVIESGDPVFNKVLPVWGHSQTDPIGSRIFYSSSAVGHFNKQAKTAGLR